MSEEQNRKYGEEASTTDYIIWNKTANYGGGWQRAAREERQGIPADAPEASEALAEQQRGIDEADRAIGQGDEE